MAGLFFCLASDTVQGFSFARMQYSPAQAFTACFVLSMQFIPPMPQSSAHGFTVAFPAIAPAQQPTIQDRHKRLQCHLRHAGGHTRARTRSTDTRYNRHAGTLHRSAQTAYYNNVYKRADHASGGGSASPPVNLAGVSPAACNLAPGQRSGRAVWHPPPGGALQQQGHGGRRGTIGGSRRISFRAIAR